MELESLGGSGLFPGAAILEHSCMPNCSFTTTGGEGNVTGRPMVLITCVQEIRAGERLSIDYGELHYRPAAERRSFLLEKYGFECACSRCQQQPDFCRAFWCPSVACSSKEKAIVYPTAPRSQATSVVSTGSVAATSSSASADSAASASVVTGSGGDEATTSVPTLPPAASGADGGWTACPHCGQVPTAKQVR